MHSRFCSEAIQGHVPFSCVCPRSSAKLCCGVGWSSEHCGCRNLGGCAATWALDCLCGRFLPGPVCPRSDAKLKCGVGRARVLLQGNKSLHTPAQDLTAKTQHLGAACSCGTTWCTGYVCHSKTCSHSAHTKNGLHSSPGSHSRHSAALSF